MQYVRVHETSDGLSHFEDVVVDLAAGTARSDVSATMPVTGVVFVTIPPGFDRDWHPAPQRQFIITLAGEGAITSGDGETRRITPGTVVMVEDTTGKGHVTRNAGPGEWRMVWVTLGEMGARPATTGAPSRTTSYQRIAATPEGESRIEAVPVEQGVYANNVARSEQIAARGIFFRRSPADYHYDSHNAPRRQFVFNLSGAVEIVASDGKVARLDPGGVLLAEDTTGKGHISRGASATERLSAFVTLE